MFYEFKNEKNKMKIMCQTQMSIVDGLGMTHNVPGFTLAGRL
jgi:hypothetical protein